MLDIHIYIYISYILCIHIYIYIIYFVYTIQYVYSNMIYVYMYIQTYNNYRYNVCVYQHVSAIGNVGTVDASEKKLARIINDRVGMY